MESAFSYSLKTSLNCLIYTLEIGFNRLIYTHTLEIGLPIV